MRNTIGIRVEPGDLTRVGDPRDLGDLYAIMEGCPRIIQELVLMRARVVEIAVLTGGRIAVVARHEPFVVDPQELGEDERSTRLARNIRDGRVGDGGAGDVAVARIFEPKSLIALHSCHYGVLKVELKIRRMPTIRRWLASPLLWGLV